MFNSGTRVVSVANPLRKNVSEDIESAMNAKYSAVLDHLRTPPQVKEQLMKTQSMDKKAQTVEMHKKIFEVGGSAQSDVSAGESSFGVTTAEWGDREEALLASIQKAKLPDLQLISKLKALLSGANRRFMASFAESGGIAVLLRLVETRLIKRPLTELDVAILYEILGCCKAVMNNPLGIEEIAKMPGAIDIFTRCLRFDYKLFAVQVLEILSVCAFYSEKTAQTVHASMRQHARYYQEAPFASLTNALVEQDIEVKAAVILFVHSLIMGVGDANIRLALRSELACQLFDEKLDLANSRMDKELALLEEEERQKSSSSSSEKEKDTTQTLKRNLRRRSLITIHGPKAMDERKIEAMISSNQLELTTGNKDAEQAQYRLTVTSNGLTMHVNPLEGTMAGLMHAAKNSDKIESRFLDMVGGKKTKRRWFELTNESFKWCGGHDKENDYKGVVSVGTIVDIRPFSTDPSLLAATAPKLHCFEIETNERVYAFGLEAEKDKDHWLTAFQRARENFLISKGTYKMQYRELSVEDVFKFAAIFRKYTEIYTKIAIEDRRSQVENCGLDLESVQDLSRFLIHETTAMGAVGRLQQVLYELLILPAGAEGAWDAVLQGIVAIRDGAQRSHSSQSVLELFKYKIKHSGSTFAQVHNLALKVMDHENEIDRLQRKVRELEESNAKLKSSPPAATTQFSLASRHVPLPPPMAAVPTEEAAAFVSVDASASSSGKAMPPTPPSAAAAATVTSSPPPVPRRISSRHSAGRSAPPPPPVPAAQASTQPPPVPPSSPLSSIFPSHSSPAPPPVPARPPASSPSSSPSPARAPSPSISAAFSPVSPPIPPAAPVHLPPPVPSIPAPAPVASAAVNERYAKYEKMRKMLPEGAVRQKMMVDGFSEDEIEAFFNGEIVAAAAAPTPPVPAAPALPAVQASNERYAKYDKMCKMLPEGAVRQKMMVDGFSEDEIEAFFNGEIVVAAAPAAPAAPAPAAGVDERYAKYDKMRKMLPEGAVRQKMMVDGFTESEIDAFFNGEISAAPAAPSVPSPPVAAVDERYAKYDKMRKMLPEGAVRQKMMVDGFTESEIEAFLNGQIIVAPAAPAPLAAAAVVDERYAKYDKMRKMLPEGAVRQKMMTEGFSQQEIDAYFNGEVPAPAVAAPAAPAVVDERYAKYDKMRKMLPEGAVRQKMMTEGFTQQEIDAYFSGQAPPAAAAPPAPVVDERYAKYEKMRKMLPEGAVRQKMMTEGFSQQEIDVFFSGQALPAAPAPAVVDERYAKYDKMRKMLPEGAVRQKMMTEGFTQQEIDAFFGGGAAPAPAAAPRPVAAKPAVPAAAADIPEGMDPKPKIKPSVKLKGLFWTKMKGLEVKNTIWYKLQEHGLSEEDRKMLEEWFAAKVTDTSVGGGAGSNGASAKGAAPQQPKLLSVLDGKRTQNVSILMGKLRKGPEEITQLLISLDPSELTVELTSRLIENLPTAEELAAVKAFKDSSGLDSASKLIFEFNRIPRLNQRMECHELTFLWGNNANTANKDVNVLAKAVKEMTEIKPSMEQILSMILAIGNHINGDTARGQAYGVKIDIFSKLVNLKAMLPSQGSLMNFLALMIEQNSPSAVEFYQSWIAVWVAADISFKQLQTDVNQLETQIKKVSAEVARIKPGPENPGLDGVLEDCNAALTKPLHTRLTNFLNTAQPQLQAMKENIAAVETNLEKLMNEYGESLKSNVEGDPAKRFFSTLVEFAKAFQAAHDDNVAKRQAQEKAAKALAEAEQKAQQQQQQQQAKGPAVSMAALAKAAVLARQNSTSEAPPENLFGRFHEAQNASTGDVLASFKSQLNKRLSAVPKTE